MSENTESSKPKPTLWKRVRSSPWFHLIAALLVIATVHGFIVKPYAVPSGSMERTLEVGDRIYVSKLPTAKAEAQRGDIVVFNASDAWGQVPSRTGVRWFVGEVGDFFGIGPSNQHALVKRVVGTPGETVSCCSSQGAVEVDGEALSEPYIYEDLPFEAGALDCSSTPRSMRCFPPITVGTNQYLMMGDHRSNSNDSVFACRGAPTKQEPDEQNCTKFAANEDIVGKVIFRAWPLSKIRSF